MARALLQDGQVVRVTETELDLSIPADPDAVYYLRPLTVQRVRALVEQHTTYEFDKRTRKRVGVPHEEGINDALLDYAIERWEGVANGATPAPCDLAHKLQLPIEVQRALIERAQIGQGSAEVRAQSFSEPT